MTPRGSSTPSVARSRRNGRRRKARKPAASAITPTSPERRRLPYSMIAWVSSGAIAAVALGPVRAAQARAGQAHGGAGEHDERERGERASATRVGLGRQDSGGAAREGMMAGDLYSRRDAQALEGEDRASPRRPAAGPAARDAHAGRAIGRGRVRQPHRGAHRRPAGARGLRGRPGLRLRLRAPGPPAHPAAAPSPPLRGDRPARRDGGLVHRAPRARRAASSSTTTTWATWGSTPARRRPTSCPSPSGTARCRWCWRSRCSPTCSSARPSTTCARSRGCSGRAACSAPRSSFLRNAPSR